MHSCLQPKQAANFAHDVYLAVLTREMEWGYNCSQATS